MAILVHAIFFAPQAKIPRITDKSIFDLQKINFVMFSWHSGALADLEDKRDARVASTFADFQARCRGFMVRRRLQKLQVQDLAIRCIQKNLRKYQAVRKWPWWSLYTKVRAAL